MMSLRAPLNLSRRASPAQITKYAATQQQNMATVVPPVTQDSTGKKGPTAMVFMNMGGPSTTAEVGDFLSRLFVRPVNRVASGMGRRSWQGHRPTVTSSRSDDYRATSGPSYRDAGRQRYRSSMPRLAVARQYGSGPNTSPQRCASSWTRQTLRLLLTSHMSPSATPIR